MLAALTLENFAAQRIIVQPVKCQSCLYSIWISRMVLDVVPKMVHTFALSVWVSGLLNYWPEQ